MTQVVFPWAGRRAPKRQSTTVALRPFVRIALKAVRETPTKHTVQTFRDIWTMYNYMKRRTYDLRR